MQFINRISNLPSISTKELASVIMKKKMKKKTNQLNKISQSQVDVVEPYYYDKHQKKILLEKSKFKQIASFSLPKRNYLKKNTKGIFNTFNEKTTSQRKMFHTVSTSIQDEKKQKTLRPKVNVEEQIKKKIKNQEDLINFQIVDKLKKKYEISILPQSAREIVNRYFLQKFQNIKKVQDIKINIQGLSEDRKFIEMMHKKFPLKEGTKKLQKRSINLIKLQQRIPQSKQKNNKALKQEAKKRLTTKKSQKKLNKNQVYYQSLNNSIIQNQQKRQQLSIQQKQHLQTNLRNWKKSMKKNSEDYMDEEQRQFSKQLYRFQQELNQSIRIKNSLKNSSVEKQSCQTSRKGSTKTKTFYEQNNPFFQQRISRQNSKSEKSVQQRQSSSVDFDSIHLVKNISALRQNLQQLAKRNRNHKKQLRERANKLLKQNLKLIKLCQGQLSKANLSKYILKGNIDSVFTKKRKIRKLRYIMRKDLDQQVINIDTYYNIVQYLNVFQQNCDILVQAQKSVDFKESQSFQSLDLIGQIKKNQLKFYDIYRNHSYDDTDLFDKFTQNSYQPQKNIVRIFQTFDPNIQVSKTPKKQNDLVQICLPNIVPTDKAKVQRKPEKKKKNLVQMDKFQKLRATLFQQIQKQKSKGKGTTINNLTERIKEIKNIF